ncbi:aminomethyl-transferring glycine dehydrogenase subunit GcvPA [bacterium]|nr:aminomethyl-transferring glycine dehydrogenase subunit GcvPA [bacterium]
MLEAIGLTSVDDLFAAIPPRFALNRELHLPSALTEWDLTRHLSELAHRNESTDRVVSFLGGGAYDHFVPAVVDTIASRSEYYTAYTPYQAEVSQGTLQVGFEFQSLVCSLTGLDVSNTSLYEGATALVEAVNLALNATGRPARILISEGVHPEYRQTLATYRAGLPTEIVTIPLVNGLTDGRALARQADDRTAAIVVQSPNFLGGIESVSEAVRIARGSGALTVQVFDPISLGMLPRPGDLGVDVAVAEGQSLGTPLSYGGPYLGLFACRSEHLRRVPGRMVGETTDRLGRRCFVLTLQTREQHIRRDKATSNICSNQALLALRASVYLALMGPHGMREVAELCWHKAHYAAGKLAEVPGLTVLAESPFFKEFVIETPGPAESYLAPMLAQGIHAGIPLGRWFAGRERELLVAFTEKRSREEIDHFADAWRQVLASTA